MTIRDIINKKKYGSYVPKIQKCSCVNVGFINHLHQEDEVQLTVSNPILSMKGIYELSELFASLCKEFNTDEDSVIYVEVVGSANTMDKLIKMGY